MTTKERLFVIAIATLAIIVGLVVVLDGGSCG